MNPEQTAAQIVDWLKKQLEESGAGGFVFGLSGGIDSAVLAVLCQRATPGRCRAVIMPCQSSDADGEHARLLTGRFNIPVTKVNLDEAFACLSGGIPAPDADDHVKRLADANLKARLRMATLYYTANHLGYLVAGSGNRSELAIGYLTKYGDSGVDNLPLAGLLKKDVFALARHLGIPGEIISRPPSAGLWPEQTDEAEMGFSYAELDTYLETGSASPELKKRIDGMIRRSAHKRNLPPALDPGA